MHTRVIPSTPVHYVLESIKSKFTVYQTTAWREKQ